MSKERPKRNIIQKKYVSKAVFFLFFFPYSSLLLSAKMRKVSPRTVKVSAGRRCAICPSSPPPFLFSSFFFFLKGSAASCVQRVPISAASSLKRQRRADMVEALRGSGLQAPWAGGRKDGGVGGVLLLLLF